MNPQITELIERVRKAEDDLEIEIARRGADLHYKIHEGVVSFERDVLRRHRELRVRLTRYILDAPIRTMLVSPVIYALILPLVFLDISAVLYQAICFRVYGIAKVERRDHLIFDRAQLAYLNPLEKLNCAYCSYANGVIGFVREIASRTEQYWCPIKHARRVVGAHGRYGAFADFGDAEAFRRELARLRAELKEAK